MGGRIIHQQPEYSSGLSWFAVKKFRLLVLGSDCLYNPSVATQPSYVGQLTRRLVREGLRLTVECHAPLSLTAMTELLPRLPLQQYDLIVLQPGHADLQASVLRSALFSGLSADEASADRNPQAGFSWLNQLGTALLLTGLRLRSVLTGMPRLRKMRHELRMVLDGLQPCGHNVVVITPFPLPNPVGNWLRQRGRRVFLEEGYRAFMPVFDAYALLDVGDVCFLPGPAGSLNALGHELVGSALYDFFRAGVQVVGDPSSYRRHE